MGQVRQRLKGVFFRESPGLNQGADRHGAMIQTRGDRFNGLAKNDNYFDDSMAYGIFRELEDEG